MQTASLQSQGSLGDALNKASSLNKVINLASHCPTSIGLAEHLNTPIKRQNYADTLLTCINHFIEDQPILAKQISSITKQLDKLFNNRDDINYEYIQNITANLPKLIIHGQLTRIKQLHQNWIASYSELIKIQARINKLQSSNTAHEEYTKNNIRNARHNLDTLRLKLLTLYESLRDELALALSFFPESKERELLKDATNALRATNISMNSSDTGKVQKTSLNTLEEENDPTSEYYPAAFSLIEARISHHIRKALALLTSQANTLSTGQFFRQILKLIQLINMTLNIHYQVSDEQNKIAQLHISYRALKHALAEAAKYAINNLTDIEIIQFVENRNQDFVNLVAIMPLRSDSHLDNITAEFIFELFESHIAPRYKRICPEKPLDPENPLETRLVNEDIQTFAHSYLIDGGIEDAFSTSMERAETGLQHHASYANPITIEENDLEKLRKVNTPEKFLAALGKLTKMLVEDCQGNLLIGLKKFSLLLQHKPLITVNYREVKLTETQTSSLKCSRELKQSDFESIIAFCNSHSFTDALNDLEVYLPDEGVSELNAVRLAMISLKRFLNHQFAIKAEKYQPTNQSLSYIQRVEHALKKYPSRKMLSFLGQPYATNAPSDSRKGIELELKSVDRRSRQSMDATASHLYQWALFKRDSIDSSRRSDDTDALINETCRNFIATRPREDKEIAQLKLKAACLKEIKKIVYADELNMTGQISYRFFGEHTHHFQAKGIAQFRPALKRFEYEEGVNEAILIDKFFLNTLFKKITQLYTETAKRKDTYSVANCFFEKKRTQETQLAYNKIERALKNCNLELERAKSAIAEGEGDMYDVDLNSTAPNSRSTSPLTLQEIPANDETLGFTSVYNF